MPNRPTCANLRQVVCHLPDVGGDRMLNDVYDSLAKGNIDESRKGKAEVCDNGRASGKWELA